MYPVSQVYIDKLKSISKKQRRIRGTIGSVSFTHDDVLEGSFTYTDIAVKSADIKLGGVFIGTLKATFLKSLTSRITRGTWKGKIINVEIGLHLGGDIWEYVPLKPYVIQEANHSALGVDIVASDYMSKFDASLNFTTTSGKMFDLLALGCENCGVQLGMTKAEVEALPNGTNILGLYPENDCETWRDLISWLAVTACGFATIDREGRLVIRTWKTVSDIEIGVNDRFNGGSWSDFVTYYTAVKTTNIDGTTDYTPMPVDDGLTMEIGTNPFMQYGTNDVKSGMRNNILIALQNLRYTPFNSTSLIDPALDLGDVILYSDGIANDALSCVMRIDFSFSKGATVKGYGKNPSLNGARSATDKAISQAVSKTSESQVIIHTYTNAEEYDLQNHLRSDFVVGIDFATMKPTIVTMQHEINLDLTLTDDTATVTAYYYLNDELQSYQPVGTFSEDGKHIIPLMYFLNTLVGGEAYSWQVKLQIDGGTATIDRGDIHAWLQGQGLVAVDEFAGTIHVDDTYQPVVFDRQIAEIVDTVTALDISAIDVDIGAIADMFDISNVGKKSIVEMQDSCTIQMAYVVYALVTDDGFAFATDDGYTLTNSDGGWT
jgi:hypothetical protein